MPPPLSPDALSVTLRALALCTLFQAAGATFFLVLLLPRSGASWPAVRRLALAAALGATLLALAHQALEAARMAGDYSGLWDLELQALGWRSRPGRSTLAQVTGLLIMLLSLWRLPTAARTPARAADLCAWAGGALALCALLMTGHTSAHASRAILAPLLGLHVLVVAFWFGALWPLLLVIRRDSATAAARIAARYSALAGYLVPLIAVAGVAMAWILTGGPAIFRRPYGELLLLKLLLFGLLMLLAARNKWRLVPALATPATAAGARIALRRSVIAEFLLIAMVLTVTATLTTLYSPH